MKGGATCPGCGREFPVRIAPFPTADIIIRRVKEGEEAVILVRRRNPPHGWAIPGGFVEYGERAEECAVREAEEETGGGEGRHVDGDPHEHGGEAPHQATCQPDEIPAPHLRRRPHSAHSILQRLLI